MDGLLLSKLIKRLETVGEFHFAERGWVQRSRRVEQAVELSKP